MKTYAQLRSYQEYICSFLSHINVPVWITLPFASLVMMLLVHHYNDVIISTMVPQITSLTIVTRPFIQETDQRKHGSSAPLAFVRWPVNSPLKGPVTRKMFPFDDVIMCKENVFARSHAFDASVYKTFIFKQFTSLTNTSVYHDIIASYTEYEMWNVMYSRLNEWRIYMRRQHRSSLIQIMACRLFGANPLSEPMLEYCEFEP